MPRGQPVDPPPPALSAPSQAAPGQGRIPRRWIFQLGALALVVGAALVGLIWLGSYAREKLKDRERFQIAIAEIECIPTPPMDQAEFLEEVLYHSDLPERFSIFDADIGNRLMPAFGKHPWVARVDTVVVAAPRTIQVKLTYRLPILAVEVPPDLAAKQPDSPAKPTLRAVDEHSIVLPKKANLQGLVILRGVPRPAGGAGQPWGDSGVAVAASTAAYLKPHLSTLGLNAMTWTEENLILWRADIKAIWGGGPSAEKKTQAPTAIKKRRLLEAVAHAPPIPAWLPVMHEFDVRPLDGLGHRFVRREAPP